MNSYKELYYKVTVWLKLNRPKRWHGDKKKQLTFSFEYYVNSDVKLGQIISKIPSKVEEELGKRKYEISSILVTGHGAE